MTPGNAVLASLSAAMDGGFTAIADVSAAMATTGAADDLLTETIGLPT